MEMQDNDIPSIQFIFTNLYVDMSNNLFCFTQSRMNLYEYTSSLLAVVSGVNSLNTNQTTISKQSVNSVTPMQINIGF